MKTTIHSCGGGMTPRELLNIVPDVDAYWPEIVGGVPIPEEAQVEIALSLIGKTIVTVSPTIILTLLREVRVGRLPCADLEIYCNGRDIGVDVCGELINLWPGGFFLTRGNLLFHDN